MAGWTPTELIDLADRRTERRGTKTLDLNSEFVMALHEFCLETRWEWRRLNANLPLVAGTWQYDLSTVAPYLHQFVKHGVKFYPNPGAPQNWAEITPLFEKELQIAASYANQFVPQPAPPQQYFMKRGVTPTAAPTATLCITPVPERDYPATLDYWAVPELDPTDLPDFIPLVPPFLHHVLLKKLEAEIFRYTIGEGADKFKASMGQYTALMQKYQLYDSMVPGEQLDYSGDDDYETSWSTGHNAVQSTT